MQWLLFQYNVPNKPSKLRVYVWRKLKAIRAEQLTDSLYVLPQTERTTEQLEWLRAEVQDMGGSAMLWRAECFSDKQEAELIDCFQKKASEGYEKIQRMLAHKPDTDQQAWLDDIIKQYADVRFHDYFDTQQKYTIHTQIEQHYRESRNGSDKK